MSNQIFEFKTFAAFKDCSRQTTGAGLMPHSGGKYKFHISNKNGTHAQMLYTVAIVGTGTYNVCKYEPGGDEVPLTDDWIDTNESNFSNNGQSLEIIGFEII